MLMLRVWLLLSGLALAGAASAEPFVSPPMTGRATGTSALVNLVTARDLAAPIQVRVRWSLDSQGLETSPLVSDTVAASEPLQRIELNLVDLQPNAHYYYLTQYEQGGVWYNLEPAEFSTQKTAGNSFVFCMISDGHWGRSTCGYEGATGESWNGLQCVNQIVADGPYDFCIDGGDQAAVGPSADPQTIQDKYIGYRQVMAPVFARMHTYFVLGNHEREAGYYRRGRPAGEEPGFADNNLGPEQYQQKWGTETRLTFIPNPCGTTYPQGGEGAPGYDTAAEWGAGSDPWNDGTSTHLQNFYAWTWGDALFIVLDPFRYSLVDSYDRPTSPTDYRLGPTQLQWVADTLADSEQVWKFVISHHQVGGGLIDGDGDPIVEGEGIAYGRGSAVEADRPGTDQAVLHQLMVDHGVQFFLYGHEHAFAHSVKDGVNYILCAKPTNLHTWLAAQGMRDSYGDLLQQGQDQTWMRMLLNVLGYIRFEISATKVTMHWRRTGFAFQNGYPLDFENDSPPRNWKESWYGKAYAVDSPFLVTVSELPLDVDGIRTALGAAVTEYHVAPPGADYYTQPVPVRPEEYTTPQIPMGGFPESVAVVDYVPETVYSVTWFRADLDHDGDVDLSDFATFALCYAGAMVTVPPPSCSQGWFASSDLDGDGDVDLSDFGTFALNFGR